MVADPRYLIHSAFRLIKTLIGIHQNAKLATELQSTREIPLTSRTIEMVICAVPLCLWTSLKFILFYQYAYIYFTYSREILFYLTWHLSSILPECFVFYRMLSLQYRATSGKYKLITDSTVGLQHEKP